MVLPTNREVFHLQLLCTGLIQKASQIQSSYTFPSKPSARNLRISRCPRLDHLNHFPIKDSNLFQDQARKHRDPGGHLREHHPLLPGHAAVSEGDPRP